MNTNEYQKVSIRDVRKSIKVNGKFTGFMVGNKVSPNHFFRGWNLARKVELNSEDELERRINAWKYYNSNSEHGKTPAWYIFKQQKQ